MSFVRFAVATVALMVSVSVSAQELNCAQGGMGMSDRAICGSKSLIKLDREAGKLARTAAIVSPDFQLTQQAFKSALIRCVGEESCIQSRYDGHIDELNDQIRNSRSMTDSEQAKLAEDLARADARFDAQAADRARIHDELKADIEQSLKPKEQVADQSKPVYDSAEDVRHLVAGQDSAQTSERANTKEGIAQIDAASAKDWQADLDKKALAANGKGMFEGITEDPIQWFKDSWFWLLIMLGMSIYVKHRLNIAVRRCPKCFKWWAGKEIDSDSSRSNVWRTHNDKTVFRDKAGNTTGSSTTSRKVRVTKIHTTTYFKCKHCNHGWTRDSSHTE